MEIVLEHKYYLLYLIVKMGKLLIVLLFVISKKIVQMVLMRNIVEHVILRIMIHVVGTITAFQVHFFGKEIGMEL
jgi:hypothetical protein